MTIRSLLVTGVAVAALVGSASVAFADPASGSGGYHKCAPGQQPPCGQNGGQGSSQGGSQGGQGSHGSQGGFGGGAMTGGQGGAMTGGHNGGSGPYGAQGSHGSQGGFGGGAMTGGHDSGQNWQGGQGSHGSQGGFGGGAMTGGHGGGIFGGWQGGANWHGGSGPQGSDWQWQDDRGGWHRDHDRYWRPQFSAFAAFDRIFFELRRHRYDRFDGQPYWFHGRYVVRTFDRYGNPIFVEINPYTGEYIGVVQF